MQFPEIDFIASLLCVSWRNSKQSMVSFNYFRVNRVVKHKLYCTSMLFHQQPPPPPPPPPPPIPLRIYRKFQNKVYRILPFLLLPKKFPLFVGRLTTTTLHLSLFSHSFSSSTTYSRVIPSFYVMSFIPCFFSPVLCLPLPCFNFTLIFKNFTGILSSFILKTYLRRIILLVVTLPLLIQIQNFSFISLLSSIKSKGHHALTATDRRLVTAPNLNVTLESVYIHIMLYEARIMYGVEL